MDELTFRKTTPERPGRRPAVAVLAVAVLAVGLLGAWVMADASSPESTVDFADAPALPERGGKAPEYDKSDETDLPGDDWAATEAGEPTAAVLSAGEGIGFPEVVEWYRTSDDGWIAMYGDVADGPVQAEVSVGSGPADAAVLGEKELGSKLMPGSVVVEHERLGSIFVSQGSLTNVGMIRDGRFVTVSIDRSVSAKDVVARFDAVADELLAAR